MAFVITRNLSVANDRVAIYELKTALKAQGWTVLGSGDGLAIYSAAADIITHSGAGANGMGNNRAWFRIEDPASGNEFVFQSGSSGSQYWSIYRSAAAGFVGGAPDFQTLPTAADQNTCTEQSSVTPAGTFIFNSATWPQRVNIGVQNAAHQGIYDFWMTSTIQGVGTYSCCIVHAAMDGAVVTGDADPAVVLATAYSAIAAQHICNPSNVAYGIFVGMYGTEWAEFAGLAPNGSTTVLPAQCHTDHASNYPLFPFNLMRMSAQGAQPGWKGQIKYVRFSPLATFVFGDLSKEGANYYMVYGCLALPGWPDATPPTV